MNEGIINNFINALIIQHDENSLDFPEIIFLGDSYAMGWGVEQEENFSSLLENKINEREYELSARLEVDYLNETYNLNLEEHEAYETLGGFLVYQNEDIPKEGEVLKINNLYFKMLKVDASKILEVYLKVLDKEE